MGDSKRRCCVPYCRRAVETSVSKQSALRTYFRALPSKHHAQTISLPSVFFFIIILIPFSALAHAQSGTLGLLWSSPGATQTRTAPCRLVRRLVAAQCLWKAES